MAFTSPFSLPFTNAFSLGNGPFSFGASLGRLLRVPGPPSPASIFRSIASLNFTPATPPKLPNFAPTIDPNEIVKQILQQLPQPSIPAPAPIPTVQTNFSLPEFVRNATTAMFEPIKAELAAREALERNQLQTNLANAGLAESGIGVGAQADLAGRFATALQSALTTVTAKATEQGTLIQQRIAELEQQRAIEQARIDAEQLREEARLTLLRGTEAARVIPQVFQLAQSDIESQRRAFLDVLGEQGRLELQRSELAQRAASDLFANQLRAMDIAVRARALAEQNRVNLLTNTMDVAARALPAQVEAASKAFDIENFITGNTGRFAGTGLPVPQVPPILRQIGSGTFGALFPAARFFPAIANRPVPGFNPALFGL